MTTRIESVLAWIVALVFTVAAGAIFWIFGAMFMDHYSARSWVKTQATVSRFDVRTSRSAGMGTRLPIYQSRIVADYAYIYEGVAYTGSRVDLSFGADNFSRDRQRDQLSALRSGTITIYVDPRDPRHSVFDRSLPGGQVVFGLIFLLFPCGIGTAFSLGMLIAGLGKIGLAGIDRFFLPLLGMVHGLPALYPVLYAPADFSAGGWIVLAGLLALLLISSRSLYRRIKDPSLGSPGWGRRLWKPGSKHAPEPPG